MVYKIDVKGFFDRRQMRASVGGIMKKDGKWVRGFGGYIGLWTPGAAELWAIWHGLKMAWEREKTSVVIFSSCREAVEAINNRDPAYPYAMQVDMIGMILGEAWDHVEIQATTADAAAVAMAETFLDGDGGVEEMVEPPPALRSMI